MRISDIIGRFTRSAPRQTSVQSTAALLLERYLTVVEYGWIHQGNVSFTGLKNPEVFESIGAAPPEVQVEVLLLALPELCGSLRDQVRRDKLHSVVSQLLSLPLIYSANDLRTVFGCLTSPPGGFSPLRFRGEYISLNPFIPSIKEQKLAGNVDASLHTLLVKAREIVEGVPYPPVDITRELREVLGEPQRIPILSADPWAVAALADLEPTTGAERAAWIALLGHAATVSGATPPKKWMASAQTMLDAVGGPVYRHSMLKWLPRLSHSIVNDNEPAPVYEYNSDVLKGLIWCCALLNDSSLSMILADACIKCFEGTKFGQIAPASGNACILVLKQFSGSEPQQQIERLKLIIKSKTALKLLGIDNAEANAKAVPVSRAAGPASQAIVHVRAEDILGYVPREGRDEVSGEHYYLQNGVMYIAGVEFTPAPDIASFRAYRGNFAKDRNYCYHGMRRLHGANPTTFTMLNFTWATDRNKVWCLSGTVADADGASFQACDDGHCPTIEGVPYSYGKDQYRVFHYDFDGKACWVRKADSASFETVVTGEFGQDAYFAFCGTSVIARARREYWQYLGSNYSKDDRRVFYFNRVVEGADVESFQVAVRQRSSSFPQAKDKQRYYRWEHEISREEYEQELAKE